MGTEWRWSTDSAEMIVEQALKQHVGMVKQLKGVPGALPERLQEAGVVRHPDTGTPQGGVISPLLANVYLHEVLDAWWERDVRPRMSGRTTLVRYADDFVILFEKEEDARRVEAVLSKRFEKYGLKLHPEKTRLIRFKPPPLPPPPSGGSGARSSFDLL